MYRPIIINGASFSLSVELAVVVVDCCIFLTLLQPKPHTPPTAAAAEPECGVWVGGGAAVGGVWAVVGGGGVWVVLLLSTARRPKGGEQSR